MTNDERNFKRKIAIIFPCMKELKRPELEELNSEIIHEEIDEEKEPIVLPNPGSEENHVYMIKFGMFEIQSETKRKVKYLSNSDMFGLYQIFATDVKMLAVPEDHIRYYKVKVSVVEKFMSKYSYLVKNLYSRAIQNYLKCCPNRLAKTKTRYFRRLRRLSPNYLSDILDEGQIKIFEDSEALLNFLYLGHFSSIGFFALKGSFKVVHSDPTIAKAMNLFKFEDVQKIKEFLKERGSVRVNKKEKLKKKLTEDFFSIRRNTDDTFDSEDNFKKEVEINPGNAIQIHPDFLEKVEFLDSNIKIFVLESTEGDTKEKKILNNNKRHFSQIKRRTVI